jgi:hypothetical protein
MQAPQARVAELARVPLEDPLSFYFATEISHHEKTKMLLSYAGSGYEKDCVNEMRLLASLWLLHLQAPRARVAELARVFHSSPVVRTENTWVTALIMARTHEERAAGGPNRLGAPQVRVRCCERA